MNSSLPKLVVKQDEIDRNIESNNQLEPKPKLRRKRPKPKVEDEGHKIEKIYIEEPSQGIIKIQTLPQQIYISPKAALPTKSQLVKQKNKKLQKIIEKERNQECQICFADFQESKLLSISNCMHRFCIQCLKGHLRNQIKMSKIAFCPDKDCNSKIDAFSPFFKQLTPTEQEKYYNIQVYNNLLQNQALKGFINIKEKPIKCPICQIQFCEKCLFPQHRGPCDENAGLFLEDNYKFRKCQKCKMVLQKNKGCDHMTCKCGHQFCYLCGKTWANQHNCNQQIQLPITAHERLPPLLNQPRVRRLQPSYIRNIQIDELALPNFPQLGNLQRSNCFSIRRCFYRLLFCFMKIMVLLFLVIFVISLCLPTVLLLLIIYRLRSGCIEFAKYPWIYKIIFNIFLFNYCLVMRIPQDCRNREQCFGVFNDCLKVAVMSPIQWMKIRPSY